MNMALKAEKWFLGKCEAEMRGQSRLAGLAQVAWDHAHGKDKTPGHILQAVGAAQAFLSAYPAVATQIRAASPVVALDLRSAGVLNEWTTFFTSKLASAKKDPKKNSYGPEKSGYRWSALESYLTRQYGGRVDGGGGGDYEFKVVLRLMVEF
jgi:hypothetical protein